MYHIEIPFLDCQMHSVHLRTVHTRNIAARLFDNDLFLDRNRRRFRSEERERAGWGGGGGGGDWSCIIPYARLIINCIIIRN